MKALMRKSGLSKAALPLSLAGAVLSAQGALAQEKAIDFLPKGAQITCESTSERSVETRASWNIKFDRVSSMAFSARVQGPGGVEFYDEEYNATITTSGAVRFLIRNDADELQYAVVLTKAVLKNKGGKTKVTARSGAAIRPGQEISVDCKVN